MVAVCQQVVSSGLNRCSGNQVNQDGYSMVLKIIGNTRPSEVAFPTLRRPARTFSARWQGRCEISYFKRPAPTSAVDQGHPVSCICLRSGAGGRFHAANWRSLQTGLTRAISLATSACCANKQGLRFPSPGDADRPDLYFISRQSVRPACVRETRGPSRLCGGRRAIAVENLLSTARARPAS